MEPVLLIPLGAFLVLAVLFLIVLRRASRFVARTRELDGFRASIRDLDDRIGRSLGGATERIDGVRRQQHAANTIGDTLEAATDAVARYTEEAASLKGPPEALAIRDDIVRELGRAERALDMVGHGVSILVTVRRGVRELEAQTSIKRGYLNLLHARDAISRHAARVDDLEAEPGPRRFSLRPPLGVGPTGKISDTRDEASDHTI